MKPVRTLVPHALIFGTVLAVVGLFPVAAFGVEPGASETGASDRVDEVASSSASAPAALDSLWTQWRGPNRDGSAPGEAWPDSLSELESQWSVALGKGYSGPLVSADKVFVAETVDDETEGARAFDRRSGREIWRVSWSGRGTVPFFAKRNGDWIRSTPAYDGEALYVGGMEEVLYKLSAEDGAELWRIDFPSRFDTRIPDFGFASSPMVVGDSLYVQAANSIVKVDRKSGETIWRALENDGSMQRSGAFSSPLIAEIAGRFQLVVQTREVLYGLDPETGEALWSQPVPSFRGMNILTPTVHGDRVFTSSHRNRSFYYEISGGPDGFEVTERWNHKAQGYMSTPVVIDGMVYLHLGNGRLTAIDLETGQSSWTSTPFGSYWSLVRRGDKILALDSDGELLLVATSGDQPTVLDRTEVSDESTWGHLAVSEDQLFVRGLEGLRAFRLQ